VKKMPRRHLTDRDDFFCGLIDRWPGHVYWFGAQESSSATENRPNKVCEKIMRSLLDRKQSVLNVWISGKGAGRCLKSKS
jgi:hypothetical protein